MVLELKVPREGNPAALLALWPTFTSYALSYFFVGIVWVNHHHLLRYVEEADSVLIWTNLIFLFVVSLIPFSTAYMADTHMEPFPTALYAGVFLSITVAFMFFQWAIARQFAEDAESRAMYRAGVRRNWIAAVLYALAIPAAYLHPAIALGIIALVGALYFIPNAVSTTPCRE